MSNTKNKTKINSVELTGNLVKDALTTEKATIIRMALWNGKNKDGKDRPATFVDVLIVNHKQPDKLTKGTRVSIKGRLANYKDKTSQWIKTGVIGTSLEIIPKKLEGKEKLDVPTPSDDDLSDISWEMDL